MEKLNGYIYFNEDDELQEKYNDIRNRLGNNIKKELDCKPIYKRKTK